METFRSVLWTIVLLCVTSNGAGQTPSSMNAAFGTKFFADLRRVFGELQRTDLDRAFQQAKAPQCSELLGDKAEWKHVGFLNDDRTLAAWYFDSLADVKRDPSKFVFEGTCRTEDDSLRVSTSYPVHETLAQAVAIMQHNGPVRVSFDRRSQAYVFRLPYLYQVRKGESDVIYTLLPPRVSSRPVRGVAEEMRCKALSDPELTYRFLLCRTGLIDLAPRGLRPIQAGAFGSAAYYILSDGREASSMVKLTFEDAIEPRTRGLEVRWVTAADQRSLPEIASTEFRLHFNSALWNVDNTPQRVVNGRLSDLALSASPNGDYCAWFPVASISIPSDVPSTLTIRKEEGPAVSAAFELDEGRRRSGVLHCHFSSSEDPARITVGRWRSIVGELISLELPEGS